MLRAQARLSSACPNEAPGRPSRNLLRSRAHEQNLDCLTGSAIFSRVEPMKRTEIAG